MGLFKFLPRTTRCCCIRKLKTGCYLISLYSLFTGLHGIGMSVAPSCDVYVTEEADEGTLSFNVLRWSLFIMSIIYVGADVMFVVGLLVWLKSAVEGFLLVSLLWAVAAFMFACEQLRLIVIAMLSSGRACFNFSDIVAVAIYFPCNAYFAVVLSSYVEEKQDQYSY